MSNSSEQKNVMSNKTGTEPVVDGKLAYTRPVLQYFGSVRDLTLGTTTGVAEMGRMGM
jgi:hypothetical protein